MKPDAETLKRISALIGWVDDAECALLYDMASQIDDYCIVEIGSHRGKSTMALALGSKAGYGVEVFAIDPQIKFESVAGTKFNGPRAKARFFRNVTYCEVGDIVYVINLTSAHAVQGWDRQIGLLFIDGDHVKAREDLRLWHPFIVSGGFLAIHDYETWEMPRLAYQDALQEGYRHIDAMGGLAILQKGNHSSAWAEMVYEGPQKESFSIRGEISRRSYYEIERGKPMMIRREDVEFFKGEGFRLCESES